MNKNRPIFIVGCERSGTTMLRLILCSHENIAIPPQTKFFKKLYKRRFLFGNLSIDKNRHRLIKWFYNNHDRKTKIIDLKIDKADIQSGLSNAGATLGAFLSVIPKLYSDKFNKMRWGDKHPYYIKYLPQLYKLFPDAQVIHIIRDGRDAVASLKRMPWWKKSSIFAMFNWQEAIRKGNAAKKKYDNNSYMEIHYENIIKDPSTSIRSVCNFLNEDYSDDLLDFQSISNITVPDYKMGWHSATKDKINAKSIGKWKDHLDESEINLFNKKFFTELDSNGYDVKVSSGRMTLKTYFRYYLTKINYKYLQYGTAFIDKIFSLFYRWELDYRK